MLFVINISEEKFKQIQGMSPGVALENSPHNISIRIDDDMK